MPVSEPKSDTRRGGTHVHAMTCPIHHIPSPRGDGICLLGVRLDFKSYQNTLTESLRRSIRRNRSMPRARIFPNRIVGSEKIRRSGQLWSPTRLEIFFAHFHHRRIERRRLPASEPKSDTHSGEPPSIHPSHHTCQISILRPFWTPLRCVDRKKEQKGIAKP